MDVLDLMTGDTRCVGADAVLKSELREKYPNDGYINRDFEIRKYAPRGGKRYATG